MLKVIYIASKFHIVSVFFWLWTIANNYTW